MSHSTKKYWAFISYSSKDKMWGSWLHKRLENYPIPKEFQDSEIFDGAILGKNLRPIFRDRDELSGSSELGPALEQALQDSRYLIVLCSKNSAKSVWVNKEIEDFRAMGGEQYILALILDGEPNATANSNIDNSEECFPPALRYPLEPLAGDLRKKGDGKERGFLKVLSGMAQLDFDVLYRRHERAQQKKRLTLAAIATVIICMLTVLSLIAFQQKKRAVSQEKLAVEQKGIAENKTLEAQAEKERALKTADALKKVMDDKLDEIHLLVLQKDYSQVTALIQAEPSMVNQPTQKGVRPLHYALMQGDRKMYELLISLNADISLRSEDKRTALHYSALSGDGDLMEILLKHMSSAKLGSFVQLLNQKDNSGEVALHIAVKKNYFPLVKNIHAWGGKLDENNNQSQAPAFFAVKVKNADMLKYFIRYKACAGSDIYLNNIFHYIAKWGNENLLEILFKDDVLMKTINDVDAYGRTPIYQSIMFNNEALTLKFLSSQKVDSTINNKN